MASGVVSNTIVGEVLNEDNYEDWSFGVKTYLVAQDLWDVVKTKSEHASKLEEYGLDHDAADTAEFRRNNAKALHAIQISCGAVAFGDISGINTAQLAWDTLDRNFAGLESDLPKSEGGHHDHHHVDVEEESDQQLKAVEIEELFKHVNGEKWDVVKEFVTKHPNAVKAKESQSGRTVVHKAAIAGPERIVKYLVDLMTEKEQLEVQDNYGCTAFEYAIRRGDIKMVKCMIQKNNDLLTILLPTPDGTQVLPVYYANLYNQWEIARYLYSFTPLHSLSPDHKSTDGALLISASFFDQRFEIAWDLIHRYPSFAIDVRLHGYTPIWVLADTSTGFYSATPLKFWQRWIYKSIKIQPWPAPTGDIRIHVQNQENEQPNRKHLIHSVKSLFQGLMKGLYKLSGINRIYQMKFVHTRTEEILGVMCKEIKNISREEIQHSFVQKSIVRAVERGDVKDPKYVKQIQYGVIRMSIFQAVERGHVEFLTRVFKANPDLMMIVDRKQRNIFQYSIECRQEKVYKLLHSMKKQNEVGTFAFSGDKFNNTILHSAARLSPPGKLNALRGAVLQMQREFQWFKEVESFLPADRHEMPNNTDKMTPRELFNKNHKELMQKAESSIKETATSCTVVGALIVTIMFAAAFTVPAGEKRDTGEGDPIFLHDKLSMVFIVSDALSLFSSTTSVMIFLGLLTSRYEEEDFFESLPQKMILGLFTLFFSIATMMITFSAAIVIMLHGKIWIVILIIWPACASIATFVWMQYPLFIDIVISTYGPGIFDKN